MSQPRQFGNFELKEEDGQPVMLGAGSFGKTYRGKHRFLNTEVAVKIIRQRYSDDENYKKTFLQEARLVAQLSDAHIVRIVDFGEQDGRLYYVMDFCDEGTLKDLIARPNGVDDQLVIEIARQAAQALVCAHRQGIIHRDFKPENIMLASSDQDGALLVKVIDFGLAQSVGNVSGFSEARAEGFHGTPMFASPEQLREEPLDGRSDLFALGMTLWWVALGGRLPFGSEKEMVSERLEPAGYHDRLHETLSPELATLLSGLLEKDVSARHPSAEDFLALVNANFPTSIIPAMGAAAAVVAPDPVCAERRTGALDSHYNLLRKVSGNGYGAYYEASRVDSADAGAEKIWLWVFHPENEGVAEEWQPLFEQNMAILQQSRPEGVSIPLAYEEFDEGTLAYTLQWRSGKFLADGLEGRHQFSLAELMEPLERATRAGDELVSLGLPIPEFTPESIEWAAGEADFAPLLPTIVEEPVEEAGTATMGTLSPDAMGGLSACSRFVMLVYPLLAGRRFPMAALYSPGAYVAIPGISENSNRLLKEWASGDGQGFSLSSLLTTLLVSEGLKEHGVLGFGTRGHSMGTARSGFPSQRSQPTRFPTRQGTNQPSQGTVTVPLGTSAGGAFPTVAPTVSPSATTAPGASVQPPQVPQQAPSKEAGRKRPPRIAVISAGAALLAICGGVYWFLLAKSDPKPVTGGGGTGSSGEVGDGDKIVRQQELKELFFRKDRTAELRSGLASYIARYGASDPFAVEAQGFLDRAKSQANAPIRVPGDAPTLGEAMAKAVEGQTIELAAGTHFGQIICKPGIRIKGQSSGSTTLEMPGASVSLLTIRGGGTVYLEDLTLKALLREDDSPALVTVNGGALDAKDCVFKDNGSEAIRVYGEGRLDLASCKVRECDGHGIHLLGGASARLTDCEISSNGKSGIWIGPAEVSLSATGCEVTDNGNAGIEAEGGAVITLSGGSFSENGETGVNIAGLGTRLEAEATAFSGNVRIGVFCSQGAGVSLTACSVEKNRQTGILLKNADPSSLLKNTRFEGNSEYGLHVQGLGREGTSDRSWSRHAASSTMRAVVW